MTPLRKAVFLFALILSAVARAQVSTVPPKPSAGQPFQLHIRSSGQCPPVQERLDINNRQLTVTFALSCSDVILPGLPMFWDEEVPVPGLDAGNYGVTVRVTSWDGPHILLTEPLTVVGTPSGLAITPNFDLSAGNRVVHIYGKFPCPSTPCATPTVLFGSRPAEAVERKSETQIDAVVPAQTNIRFVDVTVRGDGYSMTAPSAFTYVSDSEYVPVLVPIVLRKPVSGAYGSLWTSDFRIVNKASVALTEGTDIFPFASSCEALCPSTSFLPMNVVTPQFVFPNPSSDVPPAIVFYVRSELAPFLSYESRVRDVSRQSETWGTEIPVVDSIGRTITLLDIPMTSGFRQLLRLYTPDYVGCCSTTVKFYSNSGDLLTTRTMSLQHPDGSIGGLVPPPYVRSGSRQFPLQPAYGEIDLATVPEIQGQATVWLTAQSYAAHLWGFVSVTNDATQHVTTITPH